MLNSPKNTLNLRCKLDRHSANDTKDGNVRPDERDEDNIKVRDLLKDYKKAEPDPSPRKYQMIADAEAGDPEAQYRLGEAYYVGSTKDGEQFDVALDKACEWLEKAAMQGHDMAHFALGLIAERERGDYDAAIKWYIPAATNGLMEAVTNLGVAYGMTGQDDKAAQWLKKGADMGDAVAMSRLATHYANGRGVAVDMDEAIRLYTASAAAGDWYGYMGLADMYLLPEYLDVPAAESALIKLANAGHAQSQAVLARIYMGAYGEEFVDYSIAEDLLESAVKQGNIYAVYLMGIFYYHIVGNKEWAYVAFSSAASQGWQEAKEALQNLFGVN